MNIDFDTPLTTESIKNMIKEMVYSRLPDQTSNYDHYKHWPLPIQASLEDCAQILHLKAIHLPLVRWATRALGWPIEENVRSYYTNYRPVIKEISNLVTCQFQLLEQFDRVLLFQFFVYDPVKENWLPITESFFYPDYYKEIIRQF